MRTIVIIPQFLVTDELVELADNCIKSYRENTDAFIISVDDSGEYQKAKDADKVLKTSDLVLRMPKNGGFAKSCNLGFNRAIKEDAYIVCSNNDILVHDRVIPELKRPFETFENVAISGLWSTKSTNFEGIPLRDFNGGRMSEGGLLEDRMQDGGLWMSTSSILRKIGLFDERFIRGGYEDVDLFLRARDTFGMKIVMSNRAIYWHKQGATRWNSEKIGAVNDFGLESKSIESGNLERFIEKWGFDPHKGQIWKDIELKEQI